MSDLRQCDYMLVRYAPDAVKNEFVNVGVVLMERSGEFAGVRFTKDWRRVRCMDPDADIESLAALEGDLYGHLRADSQSRATTFARFDEILSNALQMTSPKALETPSPEAELDILASTFLERPKRARGARQSGRQMLVAQMQDAFETAGVWKAMTHPVPAALYTRPGDPLKIDCAYRPNGVVRLFHAVAVASEPESAKILAFSYPRLREGIRRVAGAEAELTAIVDHNTANQDPAAEFAIDVLKNTEIVVAAVTSLPAIAERARAELRM
jgi:hypothetical protein